MTVNASRVDTEQDRYAVPGAAGDFRSGHASVLGWWTLTVPGGWLVACGR